MKTLKKMVTVVIINFFIIFIVLLAIQNKEQINALISGGAVIATVTPIDSASVNDTTIPTNTVVPLDTIVVTNTGTVIKNTISVPTATKKTVATVAPTKDTRCIVTISGSRYNVTALRSTHSGGNIFVCGTDMTATYQGQHGTSTSLIARYKI
jgi:hypothetical protein